MMLEVKNVTYAYREKKVLLNVSFTLDEGVYGLPGPNGAGKSTLIKILTLQLEASAGCVFWDGRNICSRYGKRKAAWRGMAMTMQEFHQVVLYVSNGESNLWKSGIDGKSRTPGILATCCGWLLPTRSGKKVEV